jgi:Icc-related predicted phosphoesterase
MPKLTNELRDEAKSASVNFLERSVASIGGVRFLGCTLWSDFTITGAQANSMAVCREVMNDFKKIRVSPAFRRLRPEDLVALNAASIAWLRTEMASRIEPTVVVTHHAPSARSLNPCFAGDPINGAYATDLEELILAAEPALWIHGHTHFSVDYRLGATRVVSNQRGYPGEPDRRFDPGQLVEVEG